ncbi:hypothetical protein ANN_00278 [Periplaneta americana]|uniref:Uncharacterized protein n=1 Tax=Periplaneta americana TaxID=6978 RepID=A0ABQ8TQH0_PERAM|nr:hypothetical protein ANN_00278 [Periplaneta americana]
MTPFMSYYNQEIESWMTSHPFRAITSYQIGEVMGKAYAKSATLKNAMSGFSKCSIIPFNRNVFDEQEFFPLDEQQSVRNEGEPEETSGTKKTVSPFHLHRPQQVSLRISLHQDDLQIQQLQFKLTLHERP